MLDAKIKTLIIRIWHFDHFSENIALVWLVGRCPLSISSCPWFTRSHHHTMFNCSRKVDPISGARVMDNQLLPLDQRICKLLQLRLKCTKENRYHLPWKTLISYLLPRKRLMLCNLVQCVVCVDWPLQCWIRLRHCLVRMSKYCWTSQ